MPFGIDMKRVEEIRKSIEGAEEDEEERIRRESC